MALAENAAMKDRLTHYWSRTLDLLMFALLLAATVPVQVEDKDTIRRSR
jgi:hypothetical protein